jgi:hypothetical protein
LEKAVDVFRQKMIPDFSPGSSRSKAFAEGGNNGGKDEAAAPDR